jgi:hypothetical protein
VDKMASNRWDTGIEIRLAKVSCFQGASDYGCTPRRHTLNPRNEGVKLSDSGDAWRQAPLQGQQRGNCNSSPFQMRTLRYSLRRVSPLDSVNGGTHNPKVGGSNPPPATNPKLHNSNHLKVIR